MRVAVITSSSQSNRASERRADAMARFLAARGDTVVRLPTATARLGLRSRIIPVHMAGPLLPKEGPLAALSHSPGHLAWALKVAGHLRLRGPFDAVLASDASLSLVAASIFRYRQNTPFAVNLEADPPRWAVPLLGRANAILVPDAERREAALKYGFAADKLHICPTPADPGLSDLRPRRNQSRRALGLSQDRFVTLCPDLASGGPAEAAVREAAAALASHGMFRFLLPSGFGPSRGCRALPRDLDPLLAMAAADAVVLTEPEEVSPPRVLIEALASGRPVLMLGGEGLEASEMLKASEGGSVLPAADGASLRVATFGLWADPKLAARIGAKGQQWVEAHHSVRRSGEVLAQVLDSLGQAAPAE